MTQEYLVTPIEEVEDDRSVQGIFQSDLIIRTAIVTGLADLRENPQLLDYVFASLPKDGLSFRVYGQQQVAAAKEWFLKTEIPVIMNTNLNNDKVPSITIGLSTSGESAAFLGDTHYETSEKALDETPINYGGPFIPLRYIGDTGVVLMYPDFNFDLFPGMVARDEDGKEHVIQDIYDARTFAIEAGANANLGSIWFTSARGQKRVTLETAEFREAYEIGCHVFEPTHLAWLSSIVVFILHRYKEELLEARGLTRTTVTVAPPTLNASFETSQPVFTRMVNLAGFVMQTWPKHFTGPVLGSSSSFDEINQDGSVDPIFEDGIDVDLSDLDPDMVIDGHGRPVVDRNIPVRI